MRIWSEQTGHKIDSFSEGHRSRMKFGLFSSKWTWISTMRSLAVATVAECSSNRNSSVVGSAMERRGIAVAAPPAARKKPRLEIREPMDFLLREKSETV